MCIKGFELTAGLEPDCRVALRLGAAAAVWASGVGASTSLRS
jgi:hypothetical protein